MSAYDEARERAHSTKRIELAQGVIFALLAIAEELDVFARQYVRAQSKAAKR